MPEIIRANDELKEPLWNLYRDYVQELALYDGEKRPITNHRHYFCFDQYFVDKSYIPYAISFQNEIIGFCILRDFDGILRIEEFYIHPIHRRRGFGQAAVRSVLNECRLEGYEGRLQADVYLNNEPALNFWKSAGFYDTGRRTRIGKLRIVETQSDILNPANKI